MKYVLAALAAVAAIAALVFRPPQSAPAPTPPGIDPIPRLRSPEPARAQRIIVYVAGEVVRPGVYAFRPGDRADEALRRAGGAKPDADLVAVNLAAPLEDGGEVAFPKIGATNGRAVHRAGEARSGHRRRGRRRPESRAETPAPESIDLNAADADDLQRLPGVGPALAQRIVDYRETNGPFVSVDELADVAGISPHLQDEIAGFVTVR